MSSAPQLCTSPRAAPDFAFVDDAQCGLYGHSGPPTLHGRPTSSADSHDHVADVRALLNCLMGVDNSIEGIARGDRMP